MFGEQISRSPRIASPWSGRLSTSASTSASTTAPATPPSSDDTLKQGYGDKQSHESEHQLPALHLLNMSSDDALSDISDQADGFFSLDMDVSIDQQLQDHEPKPASQHAHSNSRDMPTIPSLSERFDPSPSLNSRDSSASPLLNPALRRASETIPYSSSPLQNVGLDPIMASRSRNSPVLNGISTINPTPTSNSVTAGDAQNNSGSSPPSSFGPIAPEVDTKGNLEYKLKILPPSRERFDRLVTQLKWRLLEGGGLAVYEIGVLDDGTLIGLDPDSMKDSLKLLSLMALEVGASCHVQRVLALEKLAAQSHGESHHSSESITSRSSSLLSTNESDLSLRALAPTEAVDTLNPYILTADMDPETRSHLLETGAAGLYRFSIAEQHSSIPPPLASIDPNSSESSFAVAAVDPTESAPLSQDETEMEVSAQTKRRLLKSTLNGLPGTDAASAPPRPKKDILNGLDQSAIVYLPSKEEKRILRAAEAAQLEAAQERKMMAKMTRVADTPQPKTARARARARKSAAVKEEESDEGAGSDTTFPAIKVGGSSAGLTAAGAYSGYENVMSSFGVLSERSARILYPKEEGDAVGVRGRLIVEAVVRRDADSEDNYVDFQGVRNKLRLDSGVM